MKTILVLGGTGLLGKPVVESLLNAGYGVRVLVRDTNRAWSLLPESVEMVPGDATSAEGVEAAMDGAHGVHVSVGGPDELPAVQNVVAAASGAGIQRITYLSGASVSEENDWFPMVKQKREAEKLLEASGVPYTIFRPTWVMEQLPRFVRGEKAVVIGQQPTPIHWYAATDLARMVTAAYQTPEAAGTCLYVHGPEAIPMTEALTRYCQAEHPGVEVMQIPVEAAREAAKAGGDPMMGFFTELMAYFDKAGELGDATEADRILGPNTVTLDQWLDQRSAER